MVALLLLSAAAPLASAGTLEALSKRITNDFTARLEVDPEADFYAPNTRPRDVFEGHYARCRHLS